LPSDGSQQPLGREEGHLSVIGDEAFATDAWEVRFGEGPYSTFTEALNNVFA
jgi:hypothetical protein